MSSGKTNKSYTSRLKVTRKGKILSRHPGQNHYNALESRRKQISTKHGKKESSIKITNTQKSNFLPHEKNI